MCNCIKEVEAKLQEYYKDKIKDNTGEITAFLDGQAWLTGGGTVLSIPVTLTYPTCKKDGSTKIKKKKTLLFAKYCPFCGKEMGVTNEHSA